VDAVADVKLAVRQWTAVWPTSGDDPVYNYVVLFE